MVLNLKVFTKNYKLRTTNYFLATDLFNLFFQFRHDFKEVAYDAVVSEFEDRCIRVFVDGNDEAGVLDAEFVLDGAGNAQGDVNLRGDFLACNADLPFIGSPFFVDERLGYAEGCADALGKGLNGFHAVFSLDAAAGTDDDIGCRDGQFFRFFFDRFKVRHFDGRSSTGEVDAFFDDFAFPGRVSRRAVENLVADGSQLGARRRLDLDEELARISRTDPGQRIVIAFKADVRAVCDQAEPTGGRRGHGHRANRR